MADQNNLPLGCGNCGYPTRGISELKCPECGADLRVVGIIRLGKGRRLRAGLLPLLMTVLMLILAVVGYILAQFILPTYRQHAVSIYLEPASAQYEQLIVRVHGTSIIPPGATVPSTGLSTSNTHGPPPVTTATLTGFGAKGKPYKVSLQARPTPQTIASGNWAFASFFEIDPTTGQASWTDMQGNTQSTKAKATDRDVLAYLGAMGADTTTQAVVDEAQQLSVLIDGLRQGGSTFTVQNFRTGGSGSGGSQQIGPDWFLPVYVACWVLIWIIALVSMIRRGRKSITA